MKKYTLSTVSIHDIDLSDKTYVFTFEPFLSSMIESVRHIGLLNPPVLACTSKEPTYRLITGLKRILALKHLKKESVDVLVYDELDREPDLNRFLLNLYENVCTREFNAVEKSKILNILIHTFHLDKADVLKRFCPLIGLGSNQKVLDIYLPLDSLEDNFKIALVEDFISPEMCAQLFTHSSEQRNAILSLFYALKLGKNRQKEFIRLISDISRIEDKTICDIINQNDIRKILLDEDLNLSIRLNKIKNVLRKQRYPKFTEAEEKFMRLKKDLKLPPKFSFNPPPFFESDIYSMSFQFSSQKGFDDAVRMFIRISNDKQLKELETFLT